MTAEMAPGPARPGSGRMVRYGVWAAVITRSLGDRRFQAGVITRVLAAYALASLIKNNEARPVRRAAAWYERLGETKELHQARPGTGAGQTLDPSCSV